MQEIKDRIAEALKLKGKTPKQLSDLTGIPISSILFRQRDTNTHLKT